MPEDDNIIKNPNRKTQNTKQAPYEPQYVALGVMPEVFPKTNPTNAGLGLAANAIVIQPSKTTEISEECFEVDGNQVAPDGHFIDNNEFVFQPPARNVFRPPQGMKKSNKDVAQATAKPKDKTIPNVGEYILMKSGKMILVGSSAQIQEKVSELVYQDDENKIINELVVLKRVDLKVGIFLDE